MAVEFDGKNQYLSRTANLSSLGISNTWTLGFWSKLGDNKEHSVLLSIGGKPGANTIHVSTTALPAEVPLRGKPPSELRVLIKDSDGTTIKQYAWPDWFLTEQWDYTAIQWDGADLNAFKNGVLTTTGVAFIDSTGTMTDTARPVFYGSTISGSFATFSGLGGHFGIWDSILGAAELATITSGGFSANLTAASGSYVSQANLQHYYKPGDNPSSLGQDFVGTLHLVKQHNLDSNNVIEDQP